MKIPQAIAIAITIIFVLICSGSGMAGTTETAGLTVEGRVIDKASGEPIPYVNVGIPNAATGTVSTEDGKFRLPDLAADSVLLFSAIGYESYSVTSQSIPDNGEVEMTAVPVGFHEEVAVTAEPIGEATVLGTRYKQERGYGFGFASGLLGSELGAKITIKRPTYIKSANFMVAHTGGERFLYRVNVYDFSATTIGANLLTKNVIVEAEQKRGTLTVDLTDYGLILEGDVLLALEWIRDDSDIGNANVMFRARPRSRGRLYHKLTSQMPFNKVDRHSLGFYFVGYELE